MLTVLGEIMKNRVQSIKDAREIRLVISPLVKTEPITSIPNWMKLRREVLLMDKQVEEIEQASGALDNFQDIYKASIEGKINSYSLNQNLEDIDRFLALLQNNQPSQNES